MKVLLVTLQKTLDVMGLKCIHHYLLENGHDSRLLFLPRFKPASRKPLEDLRQFVAGEAPRVIGVSLMSCEYDGARALTARLKEWFPDVPVVWGGIHPTTASEECLAHCDYVCLGEGELVMRDLADAIEQGRSPKEIRNLCYLEEGALKQNPMHPLIEDLASLPQVMQIPPNSFVQMNGRIRPADDDALNRYMRYGTTVYNVISSRGCPFNCAYCSNSYLHKLYPNWGIRRRSVRHLIAELEQALETYPDLEYVNLQDDCFLACGIDYLKEFCCEYKARISVRLIAKSTPTYVTEERMRLLKDAGLTWFNMGLQSGSDRVCREIYNRKSVARHFLRAARVIHDLGIAPWYDLIVDNPFETAEDHYQTVETLIETPRPFYPQLFSLIFLPGTDLRERALRECPQVLDDPTKRDFYVYHKRPINFLLEVATIMHAPVMRRILAWYRRAPDALLTRSLLFLARLYCLLVLRPITYFRVIRIAQGGSSWRTLRILPNFVRVGLGVYLGLFRDVRGN